MSTKTYQPTGKVLYRCEVLSSSNSWMDEYDNFNYRPGYTHRLHITLHEVVKETDKSWIIRYFGEGKTIGKEWKKKFAHETKEQAVDSVIAIKKRAVGFASARLEKQQSALTFLENLNRPIK